MATKTQEKMTVNNQELNDLNLEMVIDNLSSQQDQAGEIDKLKSAPGGIDFLVAQLQQEISSLNDEWSQLGPDDDQSEIISRAKAIDTLMDELGLEIVTEGDETVINKRSLLSRESLNKPTVIVSSAVAATAIVASSSMINPAVADAKSQGASHASKSEEISLVVSQENSLDVTEKADREKRIKQYAEAIVYLQDNDGAPGNEVSSVNDKIHGYSAMQWAEWAIDASDKHGGGVITPGVVLAQVKAESNFDPNVVQEWSGAQGTSQFMPDTIKWLKSAGIIDSNMDPFNPADSIPAQVRYMKWIHDNQTSKKFPNVDRRTSRQLTAAGYNAGPGYITTHGMSLLNWDEPKAYNQHIDKYVDLMDKSLTKQQSAEEKPSTPKPKVKSQPKGRTYGGLFSSTIDPDELFSIDMDEDYLVDGGTTVSGEDQEKDSSTEPKDDSDAVEKGGEVSATIPGAKSEEKETVDEPEAKEDDNTDVTVDNGASIETGTKVDSTLPADAEKKPEDKPKEKKESNSLFSAENGNITSTQKGEKVPEKWKGYFYYNQYDDRWANKDYSNNDGGTIGRSGCGAVSTAIVLSNLLDKEVGPVEIANYNMEHGYKAPNAGTSWDGLVQTPKAYGLQAEQIERNLSSIKDVLDKDGYVIINGTDSDPATPATQGGHIYVIREVTDEGKLLVLDPANFSKTLVSHNPDTIFNASSVAVGITK